MKHMPQIENRPVKMFSPRLALGIDLSGQIKGMMRGALYTYIELPGIQTICMLTSDVPEFMQTGNTVSIVSGMGGATRITLLKTMPTYKLTRTPEQVTIETPEGKTLATIPADQAKTFGDVERAIWEQNKGKGNSEECVEATNYFLIHGIEPK